MRKLKFLERLKKEKINKPDKIEYYINILKKNKIKIKEITINFNELNEKDITIKGQEKE